MEQVERLRGYYCSAPSRLPNRWFPMAAKCLLQLSALLIPLIRHARLPASYLPPQRLSFKTPQRTTSARLAPPKRSRHSNSSSCRRKPRYRSGKGRSQRLGRQLRHLGEGKLVRVAAFIIEAHYADLGSGESVNCNLATEEGNDIHIALGLTATMPECSSVTAEISPHSRPTSWSNIGHFQAFDSTSKKNVVNASLKTRLQAQPFRFTGQLFFDAPHEPCPCGINCDPKRSSDWEIHPGVRHRGVQGGVPVQREPGRGLDCFRFMVEQCGTHAGKEKVAVPIHWLDRAWSVEA
jgi:hypothetical protein